MAGLSVEDTSVFVIDIDEGRPVAGAVHEVIFCREQRDTYYRGKVINCFECLPVLFVAV